MKAMEISRTGLDVEWRRLEIIAENLANMSTTSKPGAKAYAARHLVSGPARSFAGIVDSSGPTTPGGVAIYGIEAVEAAPRLVYEPGHPQADERGFVTYPAIDLADEMTQMIKTSRAYESNIVAMTLARQMYAKALELGKGS